MCSDNYYIVFKEAERPLWWMRWLRKGYSHCFAIKPDRGRWLKYESGHGVTTVDTFRDYADLIEDSIIVRIEARESKRWVSLNTCTGFVKLITGVKGWSFTPYQLYKRVIS